MSQVLPSVGRSRTCLFLLTFLNSWLISSLSRLYGHVTWITKVEVWAVLVLALLVVLEISHWGLSIGCTGRAVKVPTYLELSLMTAVLRHPPDLSSSTRHV